MAAKKHDAGASAPAADGEGAAAKEGEAAAKEGEGETKDGESEGDALVKEKLAKIDELELKVTELTEKNADLTSKLRLSYADFENLRKRNVTDVENAKSYAISKFAGTLVEVADNMQRATETLTGTKEAPKKFEGIEGEGAKAVEKYLAKAENAELKSVYEGVTITEASLLKAFKGAGIEKMGEQEILNKKFDPNFHEAMFQMDSDQPKDTVVHVMQNGWKIKDRMLRAARVGTSKGPAKK